jgi:outer membrane protein assembly factor BamB
MSFSSVAIGPDDVIYWGAGEYLHAINPDGTLKWRHGSTLQAQPTPAIAADGTIYYGAWDNNMYALNPDGSLKWEYVNEGIVQSIATSPAIGHDGTVYFTSTDFHIYALTPDGELKWKKDIGDASLSSPTIGDDGTIYVGGQRYIKALTPKGNLKWEFEGEYTTGTPVIGPDGTIYVATEGAINNGILFAVNQDGTLKWEMDLEEREHPGTMSTPAIGADGTIYIAGAYVYAINPDGTIRWEAQPECTGSAPVVSADGVIFIAGKENGSCALNSDGTLKWRWEKPGGSPFWWSPAIARDGTAYFINNWGGLYAFGKGIHPIPPSPPRNLKATGNDDEVTLEWEPPKVLGREGDHFYGYDVYRRYPGRSFEEIDSVYADETRFVDTWCPINRTIEYYVIARNENFESEPSNVVSIVLQPDQTDSTPDLIIDKPEEDHATSSKVVDLCGTASDNDEVEQIEISSNGYTWENITGTSTWSANVSLEEGQNTVFVKAVDSNNNTNTKKIRITLDLEKPTVSIINPVAGSFTNSINISGTASDNFGIDRVYISTDGQVWHTTNGTTSWTGTLPLHVGPNLIYARAFDIAENSITVQIEAILDITKPVISITSPSNRSDHTTGRVTIKGTAFDKSGIETIEISTDQQNWVIATGNDSWSRELALDSGPHTVYARATDMAGNSQTTSIEIDVVTGVPVAFLLPLLVIIVVILMIVILMWIRQKRRKRTVQEDIIDMPMEKK